LSRTKSFRCPSPTRTRLARHFHIAQHPYRLRIAASERLARSEKIQKLDGALRDFERGVDAERHSRFGRDDGPQTLREVVGKALQLIRRHAQAHCARVTSIPQEPVMEIIELLLQIHAGHASSRSLEHFVVAGS
jgi:hypothetical protein